MEIEIFICPTRVIIYESDDARLKDAGTFVISEKIIEIINIFRILRFKTETLRT